MRFLSLFTALVLFAGRAEATTIHYTATTDSRVTAIYYNPDNPVSWNPNEGDLTATLDTDTFELVIEGTLSNPKNYYDWLPYFEWAFHPITMRAEGTIAPYAGFSFGFTAFDGEIVRPLLGSQNNEVKYSSFDTLPLAFQMGTLYQGKILEFNGIINLVATEPKASLLLLGIGVLVPFRRRVRTPRTDR